MSGRRFTGAARAIGAQEVAKRGLLAGAARGLNLLERVPRRFEARGWACRIVGDRLEDRAYVAIAAVACVRLGVGLTSFRLSPGTDDPPCWEAITGRSVTAAEIVEALELRDMLGVEKVVSR